MEASGNVSPVGERTGATLERVLSIVVIIAAFSPVFVVPALTPLMSGDIALSIGRLAVSAAMFYASASIASLPAGLLVDKLGAAKSMSLSFGVIAAAYFILFRATSWQHVLVAMAVGGLGNAMSMPASNLVVARTPRPSRLGQTLGIRQAAVPCAALLAASSASSVLSGVHWRTAYLLICVAFASCSAWALVGREGTRERDHAEAASELYVVGLKPYGRAALLFAAFAAGITGVVVPTFFVPTLRAHDVSMDAAAGALLAGSVCGVAARVGWGWMADNVRAGSAGLLSGLLAAGGGSMILFSIGAPAPWELLTSCLLFGFALGHGGLFYVVALRVVQQGVGKFTGLMQTFVHAGGVSGPLIFVTIQVSSSYVGAWVGIGIISLVAGLFLSIGRLGV